MVRRMFEEGREKPPLGRNMPPVAGAIKWCRSLLVRVRSTWAGLQALGTQLEALDPGRRAAAAMTGDKMSWGEGCSRELRELRPNTANMWHRPDCSRLWPTRVVSTAI